MINLRPHILATSYSGSIGLPARFKTAPFGNNYASHRPIFVQNLDKTLQKPENEQASSLISKIKEFLIIAHKWLTAGGSTSSMIRAGAIFMMLEDDKVV
ncbi:MAG TPA: hypothetical protein V6C91_03655 [Coleofasciculaceae cyanobacterium]